MTPALEIDVLTTFVAGYLSWARKSRVYGTFLPVISYRGHASQDWLLLPSLCRQKLPVTFLQQFEKDVIQEFRNRFDLSGWTDIDVLAYARHHGAPTRLLDWSQNPFVGLWFAVSDKDYDSKNGVVFQLDLIAPGPLICPATALTLEHADKCRPVHIFASPHRVARSARQRSAFTITSFSEDYALQPLDHLGAQDAKLPIRRFDIPAGLKLHLRRLLSDVGLDPYTIYGDPDSFGEMLSNHLDFSGLKVVDKTRGSTGAETPPA